MAFCFRQSAPAIRRLATHSKDCSAQQGESRNTSCASSFAPLLKHFDPRYPGYDSLLSACNESFSYHMCAFHFYPDMYLDEP